MRINKARYIFLGLTLCCLMTIETDCRCLTASKFTDPASKAYRAKIVTEAMVVSILPHDPSRNNTFNATIKIDKSRKILKGRKLVTSRQRRWKEFTVGPFGPDNPSECIGNVSLGKKYYFYIERTGDLNYLRITDLSEPATRKAKKLMRKIVCKKCAPQAPVIKKITNVVVKTGKKFHLNCMASGIPKPTLSWYKDSRSLERIRLRGVKLKHGRRGSIVRVRKARSHMSGKYMCIAANLLQQTKLTVTVKVIGKRKKKKTPSQRTKNTTPGPKTVKYKLDVQACIDQTYCLNGGHCRFADPAMTWPHCLCEAGFAGVRCEEIDAVRTLQNLQHECKLKHDRTLIVIGIIIAVFVFIIILLASYFLSRKKRYELRQRQASKRLVGRGNRKQSQDQLLLLDHVDNRRTGVFRMAMSTQTDEIINMNDIDETHLISSNCSPNLFTAKPESNRTRNGDASPVKRQRLNGIGDDRHDGASTNKPSDVPHVIAISDAPDIPSFVSNNVPAGRVERFADPADSVPLYIDEPSRVHSRNFDNDSLRETDILDDVDDSETDSSDEENGRLVCENADNGCILPNNVDFAYGNKPDHPLSHWTNNHPADPLSSSSKPIDTKPPSRTGSEGRNSGMGKSRGSKVSLLDEVDFVHGEHPLSETSSGRNSKNKWNSCDGESKPLLFNGDTDHHNRLGNGHSPLVDRHSPLSDRNSSLGDRLSTRGEPKHLADIDNHNSGELDNKFLGDNDRPSSLGESKASSLGDTNSQINELTPSNSDIPGNIEEPEYAISESSYSDGSTPTGEVLDDLDLGPDVLDKYSEGTPSELADSLTSDSGDITKPYAAYPYAFNPNNESIAPKNKPGIRNKSSLFNSVPHSNDPLFKTCHSDTKPSFTGM